MRRSAEILGAGVLALVVSLSCLGDTYPLPEGAADEEIDAPSVIREVLEPLLGDYPGIAYAVGRGDSLLFAGGIGLADLAKDVPITATTRFRLYSVIKPITATALLAMADSGRLEVETRVDRILTGRSGSVGTVSLRHLAGHLSGIRDYRDGEWMEVSRSHCETPDDAVRRFGSDPLESRPGERYSYSSFNYVLLSAVIQRVAGEPFDRVLDSLVLEPAGATGIRPEAGPGPAVVAYEPAWFGRVRPARQVDNSCRWGAGGYVGTAPDLVRFALALMDGGLISSQARELMLAPMMTTDGDSTSYGYGWGVGVTETGRRYAVHSGSGIGGRSALYILPDENVAVALLAGLEGEPLTDEVARIAELVVAGHQAEP